MLMICRSAVGDWRIYTTSGVFVLGPFTTLAAAQRELDRIRGTR